MQPFTEAINAKDKGIVLDYIVYNIEGFASHRSSYDELVKYTKMTKSFTDKIGANFIVTPDDKSYLKYWKEIAKYADEFLIQFQKYQFLPFDEFKKIVKERIEIIKEANSKIFIFTQLSKNLPTHGQAKVDSYTFSSIKKGNKKLKELKSITPEYMISPMQVIKNLVDGVGFLAFEQKEGLNRFINFAKGKVMYESKTVI